MTEDSLPLPELPPLDPERVQWRIDSQSWSDAQSPTGHTAMWVPYVDATTVADGLDAWVGPARWRDLYVLGHAPDTMFCHLEILLDRDLDYWLRKTDLGHAPSGGGEVSTKGLVSDAFKRVAIVKWGLFREIYRLDRWKAPVSVNDAGKVREAWFDHQGTRISSEEWLRQRLAQRVES